MEFDSQPAPIKNEHPACWDIVKRDLFMEVSERTAREKSVEHSLLNAVYDELIGIVAQIVVIKKCADLGIGFYDEYQRMLSPESLAGVLDEISSLADKRNEFGISKYGTPLQPFNGRNAIHDSLEEALDLLVYFRQFVYEETGE